MTRRSLLAALPFFSRLSAPHPKPVYTLHQTFTRFFGHPSLPYQRYLNNALNAQLDLLRLHPPPR